MQTTINFRVVAWRPSVNTYLAWCNISEFNSERMSMKRVHHVNGNCLKSFQGQRSKVKVMTKPINKIFVTSLYLVEEYYITWVRLTVLTEKVSKIRGQRSKVKVMYKCVNAIMAEEYISTMRRQNSLVTRALKLPLLRIIFSVAPFCLHVNLSVVCHRNIQDLKRRLTTSPVFQRLKF